MPKKYRKLMPKGSKMMPKWMPKSMNFHTFSKKAKTLQTLCFPIYFNVLGMQNLSKINEKSMQNRCKKKVCKSMEHYANMHPKWEPKSIQNLNNTRKNGIRKLMPKFDAKKKSNPEIFPDFGSIFWPCRGVRGAEDTWKYRIDSNSLTRSLPRWGAADSPNQP